MYILGNARTNCYFHGTFLSKMPIFFFFFPQRCDPAVVLPRLVEDVEGDEHLTVCVHWPGQGECFMHPEAAELTPLWPSRWPARGTIPGPCPFPQPFARRFLPTLAYAIFSTLNGLLSLLTWQSPEPSSGLGLNVTSQIQSRAPLRGFQRTRRLRCTDPACDQVFLTRPRPGLSRWTVRFRRARNVFVLLTAVSAESRTVPGT